MNKELIIKKTNCCKRPKVELRNIIAQDGLFSLLLLIILLRSQEQLILQKKGSGVLPISKFGLMQITRQRMKPEMNINTQEVCPSCSGTGKISSAIILEDDIEKNLSYLFTHPHNNLTLVVNPVVHAYLSKGWLWSKFSTWKRKYRKTIMLRADTNYHLIEFKFLIRMMMR